jgi:hypothetical protein
MDTPRPIETTTDVDALAEAARHGPVTVHGAAGPAFVAVAPEAYARLAETERRRARDWDDLERAFGRVQERFAADLTPDEIARLEREIVNED